MENGTEEFSFHQHRQEQLDMAKLGIEAEAFARSALGRYIDDRILTEVDQLRDELEQADPDDKKINRKLRLEIKARRLVGEWIGEAINAGRLANAAIDEDPEPIVDE